MLFQYPIPLSIRLPERFPLGMGGSMLFQYPIPLSIRLPERFPLCEPSSNFSIKDGNGNVSDGVRFVTAENLPGANPFLGRVQFRDGEGNASHVFRGNALSLPAQDYFLVVEGGLRAVHFLGGGLEGFLSVSLELPR